MTTRPTATPDPAPTPSPPPASTPTQRRLLDAAFRVWEQEPPSVLFGGFTVASVARVAGVTRATFYSYWPSIDDYFDDLLDHLATLDPDGYRPGVGPAVSHLSSAAVQITPDLYEACERQLVAVMEDPAFRVRLGFVSKMDDPGTAAKLRARYRTVEGRTEELYRSVRESWGREIRPPLTPEQAHVGLHLDHRGPGGPPDHRPRGRSPRALREDHPRPHDVPHPAQGRPSHPRRRARQCQHLAGGRNAPPGRAHRRAPAVEGPGLDSTPPWPNSWSVRPAKLQASMGWHELTLADIANVTGVSEEAPGPRLRLEGRARDGDLHDERARALRRSSADG